MELLNVINYNHRMELLNEINCNYSQMKMFVINDCN